MCVYRYANLTQAQIQAQINYRVTPEGKEAAARYFQKNAKGKNITINLSALNKHKIWSIGYNNYQDIFDSLVLNFTSHSEINFTRPIRAWKKDPSTADPSHYPTLKTKPVIFRHCAT
jgi:hypothetical protein